MLSQAVDTIVINEIFWTWTARREQGWILAKIAREYGIKVVVAVCLTPLIYALHAIIVKRFGIDPEAHEGADKKESLAP